MKLRALLVAAACLALPAPALAAPDAELSMMDDQLLLGASDGSVGATLDAFRKLGADRVRVSAFWSQIAPSPTRLRKPRGFDAADPFERRYRWADLDRVVGTAALLDLRVMISISTPAPYWATAAPRRRNPVLRPRPPEFADFAQAVALRYRSVADQYGILNEPNQGAWLQPQSDRRGPVSPHLYRALARAAYPRIKTADPDSVALLGELAPSGRDDPGTTRPVRPLRFLRAMGCVSSRFRRVRSGRCRGFRPAPGDAIGHHPYSVLLRPDQRSPDRDDAAMGDWRAFLRTIDGVRARGGIRSRKRRLDVYYTEFGYQTNPPDPFSGISLARQDRYLQEAAFMAWRTPRVRALNQFRLTDGRLGRRGSVEQFREFQSGLLFADGSAKRSLAHFPNPFVVHGSGRSGLLLWGQARPGGRHEVEIQRRPPGSRVWRRRASARTTSRGYFALRLRRAAGAYRFRWSDSSGRGTSQAVTVGSRRR